MQHYFASAIILIKANVNTHMSVRKCFVSVIPRTEEGFCSQSHGTSNEEIS